MGNGGDGKTSYANSKLDFVDSLLYSFVKIKKYDVFTFDKKLNAMINKNSNT